MGLLSRLFRADATEKPPSLPDTDREADALGSFERAHEAGHLANALRVAEEELRRLPNEPAWHHRRGTVLARWGRWHEAQQACDNAARLGDRSVELALLSGTIALREGDTPLAESRMRSVLNAEPQNREAWAGLAVALYAQRRFEEAVPAFEAALAVDPDAFDVLHQFANLQDERGDNAAAEALVRRAIAADPEQAIAWKDLAAFLTKQDRYDEALQTAEEAFRRDTGRERLCGAFANLAISLRDAGRTREALAVLASSLRAQPTVDGHYAYGVALLTAGRLQEGWDHYEFRWLKDPLRALRCGNRRPVWTGQDLRGKTLLLRVEQGIGDRLQMLRYIPSLKAMGATLMMQRFDPIVGCIGGIDIEVGDGDSPDYDYYVNMLSLPRIFGTRIDNIPNAVPYLAVPAARREKWAQRIAANGKLRVGVVWAGSPVHQRDRYRSLPPGQLATLLAIEGVRWFSLQKGPAEGALSAFPHSHIERLGAELEDLTDAAAVIEGLDLVVSVDTAMAHLAGALGKPVWLLVATPADWRWLEDREDSPWYPSMRLFRQRVRNEWDEVIGRVRSALEAAVRKPPAVVAVPKYNALPQRPHEGGARDPASGLCAVAETRYGIMQFRDDDYGEGQALQWFGEWREGQSDVIRRLLEPGATILVTGAGAGSRILALSERLGAGGHALAVESDAVDRQILRQNLSVNEACPATILPGRLDGTRLDDSVDGLRMHAMAWLIAGPAVSSVALIEGAKDSLWRLRPLVCLEIHDERRLRDAAERIREFGYRTWQREEPWYRAQNFNGRSGDGVAGRSGMALLAIPEESRWELAQDIGMELSKADA